MRNETKTRKMIKKTFSYFSISKQGFRTSSSSREESTAVAVRIEKSGRCISPVNLPQKLLFGHLGSGTSALAAILHEFVGFPIFHTDRHYFNPN